MKLLMITVIVTADMVAAVYCARHLYYAVRGRYAPETAWVKARIESRRLDRELQDYLRDTDKS